MSNVVIFPKHGSEAHAAARHAAHPHSAALRLCDQLGGNLVSLLRQMAATLEESNQRINLAIRLAPQSEQAKLKETQETIDRQLANIQSAMALHR